MDPIMLATNTCSLGGLNSYNWIGVNSIVIMLSLSIASLAYVIANLVGTQDANKIKGYIRYEYVQAVIAIAIIVIVLAISSTVCNLSVSLTPNGQAPFAFAQNYVGTLLFVHGTGLITQMYAASVQYTVFGNVIDFFSSEVASSLQKALVTLPSFAGVSITLSPGGAFASTFNSYASILTDEYTPLVIATFGMLFIQYIILPLISGSALVIVLPIALIMRSLSFTGPRLRNTADSFIAIALAFYFIFPLTFVMDQGIMNWLYCANGATGTCNPYAAYAGAYTSPTISESSLFANNPTPLPSWLDLPSTFYQGTFSSLFFDSQTGNSNPITSVIYAPTAIVGFADEVSQYIFQGIVLMALNTAITIVFAIGLTKGLSESLNFLGGGNLIG